MNGFVLKGKNAVNSKKINSALNFFIRDFSGGELDLGGK
jgi:hypothetical protein